MDSKNGKIYPLVSINILTYNGQQYIQACLDSVLAQTYPKIEILVIDNASTDGTVDYLKKLTNPKLQKIFNQKNLGFAAGHNQGIRESRGKFICCLNQDVVLEKDFIEKVIEIFQKDEKIGAVQGKLYRFIKYGPNDPLKFCQRQNLGGKSKANSKGPSTRSHRLAQGINKKLLILDHTGLVMLKNRRIIARGQGQIDRRQFDSLEEIFGVDGAAPVYRRTALEDVKLPKNFPPPGQIFLRKTWAGGSNHNQSEYFDEDFFCYKEDVDLAWRLQWAGWKSIYQPKAIAWHDRTSGESASRNPISIIRERRKIGQFSKYLSFKNQRLMQIKNEDVWLFLKHLPWILPKEIAAWLYVLLFEKYTWKAIIQLFREMPRAWQKRKMIMGRKKVEAKEMERWFT